ncbi:hypothetical protein [Phormidium nigroviride]
MTQGAIPDETPRNLQEQLLMQDAKATLGKLILGSADKPLRDAPRLVAIYGGEAGDWVKMASSQTVVIEGAMVEVHWFRNNKTGQTIEFKFKRTYPKTAQKDL